MSIKRLTPNQLRNRKGKDRIVCLTAYTTPMAKMLDPHIDLMLVGDSLSMVLYGMENTLSISLKSMIEHGKAVMRGSEKACIVVDMPFSTYEGSPEQAFRNTSKVIKETGCSAIKLEGGTEMASTIRFLTERGIPVMAHVGLMPQQVKVIGGYQYQGKEDAEAKRVLNDAKAVAEAGAFAVVLECVPAQLAETITTEINIPTIGIGASPSCDGQILVTEDMLGLHPDKKPSFVTPYAQLSKQIDDAIAQYASDTKNNNASKPKQKKKN